MPLFLLSAKAGRPKLADFCVIVTFGNAATAVANSGGIKRQDRSEPIYISAKL